MWPVSQLAPRALLCDQTQRAAHRLHENTIAYGNINVNRGLKILSGRNAGERASPQQADRVRLAVNLDDCLKPLGVEFPVDIEKFQREPIPFAFQDGITPILLEFDEAASVCLIIAAVESPVRF